MAPTRALLPIAVSALALLLLTGAASTPKPFTAFDPEAKKLLAQMTLEEKIGQMTQPEQSALKDPADIENYFEIGRPHV